MSVRFVVESFYRSGIFIIIWNFITRSRVVVEFVRWSLVIVMSCRGICVLRILGVCFINVTSAIGSLVSIIICEDIFAFIAESRISVIFVGGVLMRFFIWRCISGYIRGKEYISVAYVIWFFGIMRNFSVTLRYIALTSFIFVTCVGNFLVKYAFFGNIRKCIWEFVYINVIFAKRYLFIVIIWLFICVCIIFLSYIFVSFVIESLFRLVIFINILKNSMKRRSGKSLILMLKTERRVFYLLLRLKNCFVKFKVRLIYFL